jgi:hypothetical protein
MNGDSSERDEGKEEKATEESERDNLTTCKQCCMVIWSYEFAISTNGVFVEAKWSNGFCYAVSLITNVSPLEFDGAIQRQAMP